MHRNRNIKEPRGEIHYICPNCDYSNMRVHGLFKTIAAVSSPLIERNSSWMLPAQETYTHLTSLLLSFLEHIHRADWYLPKVMPAWFLKRIKAHSNDCIGSHSGRFKSHQSYPSIWNLFLVLSYISCHRNQKSNTRHLPPKTQNRADAQAKKHVFFMMIPHCLPCCCKVVVMQPAVLSVVMPLPRHRQSRQTGVVVWSSHGRRIAAALVPHCHHITATSPPHRRHIAAALPPLCRQVAATLPPEWPPQLPPQLPQDLISAHKACH